MKSQIPTILAIFILLGTLVAILVVKGQLQSLTSNANSTFTPRDLKITNIKDTSFTVSWVTDIPTIGYVEYNSPQGQTNKTDVTSLSGTHFIVIRSLNSNTSYSIRVNSGGQFFDNGGQMWMAQTQNSTTGDAGEIISGQVINPNNLPAKNALVYVDIPGNLTFSGLVSTSGNWLVSLPPLASSTLLQITVETSSATSKALVDVEGANPVPTITLGSSYDFTKNNTLPSSPPDIPSVQITLP